MKLRSIKHRIIIFIALYCIGVHGTSMVYNFRIAQITKPELLDKKDDKKYTLLGLLFDQFRKKQTKTYQSFLGFLGSFIFDTVHYYIRTDFAVSHIEEYASDCSYFSDTETDDILVSAGRNFFLNSRSVISLSGLTGFPTHKIFRLQHTDFGYGQYALGGQIDSAYSFSHKNFILGGIRYLYFFPRQALDSNEKKFTFTIGNMSDIFISHKKNWENHGIEYGYTVKFRYGAHVFPFIAHVVEKTDYIRSNFFAVYKYKFLLQSVANKLFFNIAYGFDHSPKKFGNKYIVTLWASWNVNF